VAENIVLAAPLGEGWDTSVKVWLNMQVGSLVKKLGRRNENAVSTVTV